MTIVLYLSFARYSVFLLSSFDVKHFFLSVSLSFVCACVCPYILLSDEVIPQIDRWIRMGVHSVIEWICLSREKKEPMLQMNLFLAR